jgi:aspartate dehydrogenase
VTHKEPLRLGLIGYGAVGQDIVRLLSKHAAKTITIVGILVQHERASRSPEPPIVTTCEALLEHHPQLVVEAAGHAGLRAHGATILRAGKDLWLLSVGALADPALFDEFLTAAQEGGTRIKIVPGAIGALDALAAAAVGGSLTSVVYTMSKPPAEVLSSEEAARLTGIQEVFRGSVREAALRFPHFLNVAAAVALASRGFEQTEARVLADSGVQRSRHEVTAEGTFGRLHFEIEHTPIPSHGRSASLVAMSVVHALLQQQTSLIIG